MNYIDNGYQESALLLYRKIFTIKIQLKNNKIAV